MCEGSPSGGGPGPCSKSGVLGCWERVRSAYAAGFLRNKSAGFKVNLDGLRDGCFKKAGFISLIL